MTQSRCICLATLILGLSLALSGCGGDPVPNDAGDAGIDLRSGSDRAIPDVVEADAGAPDVGCTRDRECDDENLCTDNLCEDGVCTFPASLSGVPVQVEGNCRSEVCSQGVQDTVPDDDDVPVDDEHACTLVECVDGELVVTLDHASCQDENRCNGSELCNLAEGCILGEPADDDGDGLPDAEDPRPPDADDDDIPDCADWETCDGLDNDGNGLVDDAPRDLVLGDACYEGPEGSGETGQCGPGVRACVGGELVCVGQILPAEDEYCDGVDNTCDGEIPQSETEAACTTDVSFARGGERTGPQTIRLEFPIALRSVDVQLNIDTTGSMAGALNTLQETLSSQIVPGVADVIPDAAFGVSTFEDYPLGGFGSGSDVPFQLHQRVTNRVDDVQATLAEISLGSGNDIPESGIESLYQLATGAGTRWPRRADSRTYDPTGRPGIVGQVTPAGDNDFYLIEADPGSFLSVDVDAARVGSTLDGYLELLDGDFNLLASNNDTDGDDPGLNLTLRGSSPYYLLVRGINERTEGWYYLQVQVNGLPHVPLLDQCSALESGIDMVSARARPVVLASMDEAAPRDDPAGCFADCRVVLDRMEVDPWIRAYCFAGGTPDCGDGTLDDFEECDDGGAVSGDGCSSTCAFESDGVPRFDSGFRFDPGRGHGSLGGAGFREDALPIIIHVTDAGSHERAEYVGFDTRIEAHGTEDTFLELEKLGARIIGLSKGLPNEAPIDNLLNPPGMVFRTGATVPPCAFAGSEPRLSGACGEGECCVGDDGAGVPPPEGADGQCTLSFRIRGNGSGVTDGVVRGIQALALYATYTVSPQLTDHPSNPRDGRCFVQSIEVSEVIQPELCVPQLELTDRDADGFNETIRNATSRTRVLYELVVENRDVHDYDGDLDTLEPCGPPGSYQVTMDLLGDDVTTLASHVLTFTIEE